jgi:hypothetical protein
MRNKNIDEINKEERSDGSYVVKKSRRSNIFAFVLCVLLAFFIWAYTQSTGIGDSNDAQTGEQDGTGTLRACTSGVVTDIL